MLRAKLYQEKMARHASEERCSEVEKENAGYVDVLTETMAFLEHRSAVHKARVAALEQEVAGQAKVQRDQAEALEQLGAVVGQLQQDKTSLESEVARLSPFEAQVVKLLREKKEELCSLVNYFNLVLGCRH
jgi:ABC-type transporter Mla subunit MlaD